MPIAQDPIRQQQGAPALLLEGTVLDPPTDEKGWLRVEVAAQPGVVVTCPWTPRLDMDTLPGDAVAVEESNEGNYWAVLWWPQNGQVSTPPSGGGGTTGPPGTPGEKWFTGAGPPAGATGIVGDWYLNSTNGDYFEKTGTTTWTQRGNLMGPAGPPGSGGSGGTGTGFVTQTIGDGAAQAFTVTHNFGSRGATASVYRTVAPYDEVIAEIEHTTLNTITVRTTTVPSLNQYTVVVTGPGDQQTYTHTQLTPAAVWNITHNLNGYPSVTVIDSGGTEIITDVAYIDAQSLNVLFGGATSGKAYLN